MFHLFSSPWAAQKSLHWSSLFVNNFFLLSAPRAAMEMVYLWLLVSVFLAAEPFAIKRSSLFPLFLPPGGEGGKFITAIFCELSLFMVSQRAPPFRSECRRSRQTFFFAFRTRANMERNKSIAIFICLPAFDKPRIQMWISQFLFALRLFRVSGEFAFLRWWLKRREHLSAVFTDGFRMILFREIQVSLWESLRMFANRARMFLRPGHSPKLLKNPQRKTLPFCIDFKLFTRHHSSMESAIKSLFPLRNQYLPRTLEAAPNRVMEWMEIN